VKKASIKHKPRHPADVLASWADISKAKRLLGWRPQTTFKNGIRELIDWYNENRGRGREIATER
jgi:UDP-glucuronate 4-epimerase